MSLKWIDIYIEGLIEHCHSDDVFDLFEHLKIQIIKTNLNDFVLQGNDAVYIRNYFGFEVVFIRDDLPYEFEKFTLSHELGHAVLHTELNRAAYSNKLTVKSKLEKQADYFAIRLLDVKVDDLYHQGFTTEQIAKDLCITEESLKCIKGVQI